MKVSKETSKIHVLLTSSDSFFENYLTKGIGEINLDSQIPPTHFKTLVLGDLPYEEAYAYYLHALDKRFGENVNPELFGKSKEFFDRVFHLTGGRMYFIEDYIGQVSRKKTPIVTGSLASCSEGICTCCPGVWCVEISCHGKEYLYKGRLFEIFAGNSQFRVWLLRLRPTLH